MRKDTWAGRSDEVIISPYPKISIVTPSLNQGRFIDEAIRSVLDQGYPSFEHIVIDGVSTDNTLQILRSYVHLKWVSEPDEGQSDALNKGFHMATGQIIGWLNADDRYLPGCFDSVADSLQSRPDIDIAYGNCRWIDESGTVIRVRREPDFDPFLLRYLHFLHIPTTTTFFRRKVFEDGHFLNTSYQWAMDYEFALRLFLGGYKFAHINAFFADFRFHRESKTCSVENRQLIEHRKAQMEMDPFLTRFKHLRLRGLVRNILTIVARGKRLVARLVRGYLP